MHTCNCSLPERLLSSSNKKPLSESSREVLVPFSTLCTALGARSHVCMLWHYRRTAQCKYDGLCSVRSCSSSLPSVCRVTLRKTTHPSSFRKCASCRNSSPSARSALPSRKRPDSFGPHAVLRSADVLSTNMETSSSYFSSGAGEEFHASTQSVFAGATETGKSFSYMCSELPAKSSAQVVSPFLPAPPPCEIRAGGDESPTLWIVVVERIVNCQ